MPKAVLDGLFRAQLVWDATMARSIADALGRGRAKVVHLAGRFHSDFDGGTVQFLRRYRPGVRVLVVSLVPADAAELRPEDVGRADVVIYTGQKE